MAMETEIKTVIAMFERAIRRTSEASAYRLSTAVGNDNARIRRLASHGLDVFGNPLA